jgi:hypothetical protein
MCILISLQHLSDTFLILQGIALKKLHKMYSRLHCPLVRFSENTQILNFMKIRPVGAELFHAGGRTDIKEFFRTRLKSERTWTWTRM